MTRSLTVTIVDARGSTPRGAGTAMRVSADGQDGTIGGGALEWEATRIAREMLTRGETAARRTFPLGPDLGQCCGGVVTLEFSEKTPDPEPVAPPLFIWGAGHVGRAIAAALAPLEDRSITLADTIKGRLPYDMPRGVDPLVAGDLPRALGHAPPDADHLILTYSHDIDLALCDAALQHGFGHCGLIGSATKWARFRKRLAAMGHAGAQIVRITCPIGEPALGKHPQAIALGVAAALLTRDAARTTRA